MPGSAMRVRRQPLRIAFDALAQRPDDFDAAVARSVGVDPFCSRSEWALSFHEAFAPFREVFCLRDGDDFVLVAGEPSDRFGFLVQPLEHLWGLATPLVGPGAAAVLGAALADGVFPATAHIALFGLPTDRAVLQALADAVSATHDLGLLGTTDRRIASLQGGLDGFLARRSANVQRSVRKAERRATREGLRFTRVPVAEADVPAAYDRILAIEQRSWKAQEGNGVDQGPMKRFYERMIPRLVLRDAFRLVIAQRDGEDVGYLHGGTVGRHFRGLQFSFAEDVRDLSVGNLLQMEMVRWLAEDGFDTYDLGMVVPYKERWAETGLVTADAFVTPR